MKYQRIMVAVDIRCVLFLAVANLILVEIFGDGRNEELSQEEQALQQAMALVHMLRSDYMKVMKEKQVLVDTLAALMQQMSKPQPSPTAPQLRALANESTANTENWLNSSARVAASSTSGAPQTTKQMDIPQRRFMQDESKVNTEDSKTTDGTIQVLNKKETVTKPVSIPIPSKSAKESVARKPVKQNRPTNHQAMTKHVARTAKNKRGDFWRHLSTMTTAPALRIKTKDPVLGQIARELINEFHHGNTETLKQLKQKIILSRAFKSRRDNDEDNATPETETTDAAATETNNEAETIPTGNEDVNGTEANTTDGDQTVTGDAASSTLDVDGQDSMSLSTRNATINAYDLWQTTKPMPTFRSSLKLYLGRSSRLPTPLPKNNAYCFWEPKSPLCGLSI